MSKALLVVIFVGFFLTFIKDTYAAACKDQRPGSAPILTEAQALDKSVKLIWTEAADPVTYYLITYGTSPTKMEYGNPNVGGKGTTLFTVKELNNGIKYYFMVRAVNGCKPGELSNKLPAIPGGRANTSSGISFSIYKKNAIGSALPKEENKILGVSKVREATCKKCTDWQLLGTEVILLIFYFYLSSKFRFLNRVASIVIPVGIYALYLQINGSCFTNKFFCRYFLQLDIILFMLVVIFQKHKPLPRSLRNFEEKLERKLYQEK